MTAPALAATFSLILTLAPGCSLGFVAGDVDVSDAPKTTPAQGSTGIPINGRVQTNEGGAVAVEVDWQSTQSGALVFKVTMDTHSVNLDVFDLSKLAVLRDGSGKEFRPTAWRSAPGGHHRTGTLEVPAPESLTRGTARYIELVIRNMAGVSERVLRWDLR